MQFDRDNLHPHEETSHNRSGREITLSRTQCTPLRLQGDRVDTPLGHPVREVVQSRQGSLPVPSRTAPEHLGGCSGTGPNHRIDVVRGGLLGPEELLTAEHERTLRFGDVSVGVERISLWSLLISEQKETGRWYLLPGLEWVTPAISLWAVTKPSSATTILDNRLDFVDHVGRVATNEVEVVRRGVYNFETFLGDGGSISG